MPKDQIVRECGLRTAAGRAELGDYFVTEIDPIELGVNMNGHHHHHNNHHHHHLHSSSNLQLHNHHLHHNHHHNQNHPSDVCEEEEVLFGDDFNLNYFGIVSGNNIMT